MKGRVVMVISYKADFRIKNIARSTEGNFIIIKGTILQEDIIIIKIYSSNNRASNMWNQKW